MDVVTQLSEVAGAHPDLSLDLRCGLCGRRLDVLRLAWDYNTEEHEVVPSWGSSQTMRMDDDGRAVTTKPTLTRQAVGQSPGGSGRRRWTCHPKRCPGDYTYRDERLAEAFAICAADGQRPVVAGVDL